ncbi:Eco57I restriction-modification methylase domain-containing protein [Roseibacillus persicicus]|uniref:site-specific DNA-methyltransferase (adenine-specific) n=1 Tax=Roseibacillus persicicus TaxID=454148 RepID=A0A918WIK8_9BACT|nr:DNA methyltransferase [Roseibacillus persicicus]GHC46821.1 adenine methyltransferase [Roseibacillus persicicus]
MPPEVERLCETFANNFEFYKSPGYNETQLRREFLDPFWEALGWDINNKSGHAPAYTDVIHEASIKIRGGTKAPDYAFSINGGPNPSAWKFFLEAKKPAVNIHDNPEPARQVRRYGWSAKLPLCVLSDFEELAVYDTRIRPAVNDKPTVARTKYLTFEQYADQWDSFIAPTFSREAVLKGSFDKFAATKRKKGTEEVDDAFLREIEHWRQILATNVVLRNPQLTNVRDFNYVVQITIDRIIFLRMAEDRGTEDHGRLQKAATGKGVFARLLKLFQAADDRYNSGLFHFQLEKGRPSFHDGLTPSLTIDDQPLKDIILSTYPPKSAYEFSVLPADILGQVYEQFLGKTIQLGGGEKRRTVRIEEKPEVRKAGGVYYTPKYIVDYIVENTVGRLLNGEKDAPKPLSLAKAAKLKVLDPACGSGSFLIVAYQYLLDWHRDQYTLDPSTRQPDPARIKKHAGGKTPTIYRNDAGEYRLTTPERKRILLNNIHGVDIDHQAVEVTKLSLLLKVLEGETQQQLQRDFLTERQRILPDLAANIQCGNSLIGPDFYDQPELPELDGETKERINVFDWECSFPQVFEQGGFDAVIGNPPYIRIQSLREFAPEEADFYVKNYQSASVGNFDIYVCFIEKVTSLLSSRGFSGQIVPHKFLNAEYGKNLRSLLGKSKSLCEIISFGAEQVFAQATTYTCLCFTSETKNQRTLFQRAYNLEHWRYEFMPSQDSMDTNFLSQGSWYLLNDSERKFFDKVVSGKPALTDFTTSITQGLKTGADTVFLLHNTTRKSGFLTGYSKHLKKDVEIEESCCLSVAKSGDMRRFRTPEPVRSMIFPYDKSGSLLAESSMVGRPKLWAYLEECKAKLEARERGRFAGKQFYQYSRSQCLTQSYSKKLLVPDIAPKPHFGCDLDGSFAYLGGASGGYGLIFKKDVDPLYFLGVLNSKVMSWFIYITSTVFRGNWASYEKRYIQHFPIRPIDFSNPSDVVLHDKLVSHVESMLGLHKKLQEEQNPQILRRIESDIANTDRQIDRLVYQLYDLTPEEIAIVEASQ